MEISATVTTGCANHVCGHGDDSAHPAARLAVTTGDPSDSLVLIGTRRAAPVVARIDLAADDGRRVVRHVLAALPPNCSAVDLIAVVIGGNGFAAHRALADQVLDEARCGGAVVRGAAWIQCVATGQPWRSYLDESRGELGDPDASTAAAVAALGGLPARPSRDAVRDALRPTASPEVLARRRVLIAAAQGRLDDAGAEDIVRKAVADAAEGVVPGTDEDIADLVAALEHTARDAAIAALMDATASGIILWEHMVNAVDDRHQRRPAMLLALAYHLTGNGVGSLMAAELACLWSPPGDVSHFLKQAIQHGITPADLRCALAEAAADAP